MIRIGETGKETASTNPFPNGFPCCFEHAACSSLRDAGSKLLRVVDTRIIDDMNVIQMELVYTGEHCDSGSEAAIKIHEHRSCNFVFTCSYALIRSRTRQDLGPRMLSEN